MGGRADSSRVDQHQKLEIMDWKGGEPRKLHLNRDSLRKRTTVRQGAMPQLDREKNHS